LARINLTTSLSFITLCNYL